MTDILRAYEDFTWENFTLIGKELSKIDRENLNGELAQHPVLFQQYVSLVALSKRQLDELTADLNLIASRLGEAYRSRNYPNKITAQQLNELVGKDDEYVEAVAKVTEATHKYLMVKGMVSAMEHKKDCLIQLSSNSRQETRLYS